MSLATERPPHAEHPAPPESPNSAAAHSVRRAVVDVARGVADAAWAAPAVRGPQILRLSGTRVRQSIQLAIAAVIVTGAFFAAWGELTAARGGSVWEVVPVALLLSVPLLWVGYTPILTWRTMTVGFLLAPFFVVDTSAWVWPISTAVIYGAVIVLVTSIYNRVISVGVAILTIVVAIVIPGINVGVTAILPLSFLVVLLVIFGSAQHARRNANIELAALDALRKEDLAANAVLAERAHIARELHDVVAHHMSMIAIQAEAAPLRFEGLDPDVEQTFGMIREAARTALVEMRGIVGLLREDGASAEREPAPGLDQVDALVASARAAGAMITLEREGTPRTLPVGYEVNGYRIIQEALANAAKHSPGQDVNIKLNYAPDQLEILVTNSPTTGGQR